MAPDVVYETLTTPGPFFHSFIKWIDPLQVWEIQLRDGTAYRFPPNEPMVAMVDRFHNELTISRTTSSFINGQRFS